MKVEIAAGTRAFNLQTCRALIARNFLNCTRYYDLLEYSGNFLPANSGARSQLCNFGVAMVTRAFISVHNYVRAQIDAVHALFAGCAPIKSETRGAKLIKYEYL